MICILIGMEKMLFKFAWTHSPTARDSTIKKFMETGGMPPEGVTMLARYHHVDGTGGFGLGKCRLNDAVVVEVRLLMSLLDTSGVLLKAPLCPANPAFTI